jgi:hypothetical protein
MDRPGGRFRHGFSRLHDPALQEAFEATKVGRQYQYARIFDVMLSNPDGLIVEEAKALTNFPGSSSCAARLSELKEKRVVIPKPDGKRWLSPTENKHWRSRRFS